MRKHHKTDNISYLVVYNMSANVTGLDEGSKDVGVVPPVSTSRETTGVISVVECFRGFLAKGQRQLE